MRIISPTGQGIRNDSAGGGYYGAPRGKRIHLGVDFSGKPGQNIVMAVKGVLARICRPYVLTGYSGVFIRSRHMEIKMFYFKPFKELIGKEVRQGIVIGIMQDISKKYPKQDMTPHIHLEICSYDPKRILRRRIRTRQEYYKKERHDGLDKS